MTADQYEAAFLREFIETGELKESCLPEVYPELITIHIRSGKAAAWNLLTTLLDMLSPDVLVDDVGHTDGKEFLMQVWLEEE